MIDDNNVEEDYNIEEEIANEHRRLYDYEAICIDALNCLQENHPYQLLEFEKKRIIKVLHRMFYGEVDYLYSDPEIYFQLYNEE